MDKIEHIGIAVRSIEKASGVYEKLLGVKSYKRENVSTENVITEFFRVGDEKIELLEATSAESAISKFIEKRGEGIHHIAFKVADIYKEMLRLKSEGFTLLSDEPRPGADNKLVCFVHPKDTHGVLIELCQDA
ncbi:MAG TPA: methylmalonyl-CoA epimerase [Pedobacter sp.]|jgi:methylmalonyl-CoA/ethylmalonyl-CoA epimerase